LLPKNAAEPERDAISWLRSCARISAFVSFGQLRPPAFHNRRKNIWMAEPDPSQLLADCGGFLA
jgi:hypothetical protein